MNNNELIELLRKLLKEIQSKKNDRFEGLGLIVYDDFFNLPVTPFNNEKIAELPVQDFNKIINLLLKISNSESPFHDGFHLISNEFHLTHISNYFSTPIIKEIIIENHFGSRYRTALYGSMLSGVLFTAVLSKNYGPIIFEKGKINSRKND